MTQIVDVPGVGEVEFPDGMDDAQIVAAIKKLSPAQPAKPAEKEQSLIEKVFYGAVEPNLTLLSGSVATPIAGLAGLAAAAAKPFGGSADPAETVRKVSQALTYEPGTKAGQDAMGFMSEPFAAAERLANRAGEGATDATGSPALGAALYTALNMLPSALTGMGAKPSPRSTIVRALEPASRRFMHSALKPSAKDVLKGDADRAITTLLNEGINATEGGKVKLQGRIDTLNDAIESSLAGSNAVVPKDAVVRGIESVKDRVRNQVSPQSDLAAVQSVADSFAMHPDIPTNAIPVQKAQALKKGTYRQVRDKYGEIGSAETEAQKAGARILKEKIAQEVPDIAPLNASESELINALKMVERRAAVDANKNPLGLGPIAPTPSRMAMFLADRSALVKSLIARALNPGKGLNISDEMGLAAVVPQSFAQDSKERQRLIDALMNRR